jgi:hypothetical protein
MFLYVIPVMIGEKERDKVAASYLSLSHISCACATNKKNSASFDLQKAILSYDCSDISAICVKEVLYRRQSYSTLVCPV